MKSFSRLLGCVALLVTVGFATGCVSNDKHLYTSLPHQPLTISVIETASDTELWAYDIPVWHKLMLDFDTESNASRDLMGGPGPKEMTWSLYGPEAKDIYYDLMDRRPIQRESVQLPGSLVAMRMTIRELSDAEAAAVEAGQTGPLTLPQSEIGRGSEAPSELEAETVTESADEADLRDALEE